MRPERLGLLRASALEDGLGTLRRRYEQDGYLWMRNLLPRVEVEAFRSLVLQQMASIGLLPSKSEFHNPGNSCSGRNKESPDSHSLSLISNTIRKRLGTIKNLATGSRLKRERANEQACQQLLMDLVRSSAYEAFCSHPQLHTFIAEFLGDSVHLHRRRLIRAIQAGSHTATGAHYDCTYLRGGTDRFVTAWIPLGDIPITMGGLIYLEQSHPWGVAAEQGFRRRHANLSDPGALRPFYQTDRDGGWISTDLHQLAEQLQRRWLVADYAAGDVVWHSPYIIHAATNNDDPKTRLRLSTDLRFQRVSDAIDQRWNRHWEINDGL